VPEQPQYATVRLLRRQPHGPAFDLLGLLYPFSQLGLLTASEHVLEELHYCGVMVPLFRVDLEPGPRPHKIDVSTSLTAQYVRTASAGTRTSTCRCSTASA
jgi:hypothetical protein